MEKEEEQQTLGEEENHETHSPETLSSSADDDRADEIELAPGQCLPGTGYMVRPQSTIKMWLRKNYWRSYKQPDLDSLIAESQENSVDDYELGNNISGKPPFFTVRLSSRDVTRWKMSWQARNILSKAYDCHFPSRISDFPRLRYLHTREIIGISLAAFIYGGLHALAWSAHFESDAQKTMWQISSVVVATGMPIMHCWYAAGFQWFGLPRVEGDWRDFLRDTAIAVYPIGMAYVLARGYLVFECFRTLSHLPAGAYDVPQWSVYVPHIS